MASASATAGYGVVGTGDYNGDGTTDILLENGAGNITDWNLTNGVYSGYHGIGNSSGYSVKTWSGTRSCLPHTLTRCRWC
jgi:hypothetical protein